MGEWEEKDGHDQGSEFEHFDGNAWALGPERRLENGWVTSAPEKRERCGIYIWQCPNL